MLKKCKKFSITILLLTGFFLLNLNAVEAKSFIYPNPSHTIDEMFKEHDDFSGGNPGSKGNPGKRGVSGRKGEPGKKGNDGKRGNDGKGKFIIIY
ncbi:collagen-like triple helix repeat-containing protein [Enterococcus gallinarum]|uniref:collagen-like triple helix repeat-containing protein n=1 Tax=Enterococcus gallinarum TaxID=1353 RepID=UPI0018A97849|nr:collagen-like protein [Enterococcus gallinarum]MCO5478157.1 collagen-like protein [Enterococcus gallinarum]MDV7824208.1 collagen-like protein [Enterococcus gallinarum]MDY4073184.1 collagen-like protein [Enterococcus gallinarum]GMG59766.1 hypothetical protein AH4_31290 [Enterococcus gallinarum]